MELFGGDAVGSSLADLWEWDGAVWTQVATLDGPIHRFGFASFPTRAGDGIAIFGGLPSHSTFNNPLDDVWQLRWEGENPDESCRDNVDTDGDGLVGCADPDCWATCTPACPPGTSCDANAPRCGDGVCNAALENCHNCPSDCTCTPVCGDFFCDAPETQATCPGDCH
jgi:hypothetical protein